MRTPPLRLVHSLPDTRQCYVFLLYVAGTSPNSMRAIASIERLCKEALNGRYQLEIIDLAQLPALAKSENVIAIPTLIRKFPLPIKRIIGDLPDTRSLLLEEDREET
ncbi:MAG: thiol-disulfide isomerase [Herbaspirillum sp.]|jgi:circadian clock protein KaiB|nr:thiol-disulfide isomerase [Herbaspirillum sp.]